MVGPCHGAESDFRDFLYFLGSTGRGMVQISSFTRDTSGLE